MDDAAEQDSMSRPTNNRPPEIRLHGKEGVFKYKHYDREKREMVEETFGDEDGQMLIGTILAVRFYAEWPYDEHSQIGLITNHISDFKREPVGLFEVDWSKKGNEAGRVTLKEEHENWSAFAATHEMHDKARDKTSKPYEFVMLAYMYVPALGHVAVFKAKGKAQRALWDYLKSGYGGVAPRRTSTGEEKPVGSHKQIHSVFRLKKEAIEASKSKSKQDVEYFIPVIEHDPVPLTVEEGRQIVEHTRLVQEYLEASKNELGVLSIAPAPKAIDEGRRASQKAPRSLPEASRLLVLADLPKAITDLFEADPEATLADWIAEVKSLSGFELTAANGTSLADIIRSTKADLLAGGKKLKIRTAMEARIDQIPF